MNDLPAPSPNRRSRLLLYLAIALLAVSIIYTVFGFTRRDELILWNTASITTTGRHVQVLVPDGWGVTFRSDARREVNGRSMGYYSLGPLDRRPKILRWILQDRREHAAIEVFVRKFREDETLPNPIEKLKVDHSGKLHRAGRGVMRQDPKIGASVVYQRSNLPAFNRTYKQICNSLTIE